MYLRYFGLNCLPFETVSNAKIYVDLPEHREAFNTVLFGLRSGEGFVKVVGEVGTGKTALCRALIEELSNDFVSIYLPNPALAPRDLLRAIADELGVPLSTRSSVHEMHKYIREALLDIARDGGRVCIFVDEVQAMPVATLEELRLFSNLESSQGRLVQVILFGQPEFDTRLADYSLRQLEQRITFSARLAPLDRRACREYVQARLMAARSQSPETTFSNAAIERVYRGSGGIPRLINILCNKSMISAMTSQHIQVGRRHVSRAIADTAGIRRWRRAPLFRGLITGSTEEDSASAGWRSYAR